MKKNLIKGERQMKKLVKDIIAYNGYPKKIDSFQTEFETVNVYGIVSDNFILRYWNSSNTESIRNLEMILKEIAIELIDNIDAEDEMDWITEGEVCNGFNTIMYEVKEKQNG